MAHTDKPNHFARYGGQGIRDSVHDSGGSVTLSWIFDFRFVFFESVALDERGVVGFAELLKALLLLLGLRISAASSMGLSFTAATEKLSCMSFELIVIDIFSPWLFSHSSSL